jgi:hypothetical protein
MKIPNTKFQIPNTDMAVYGIALILLLGFGSVLAIRPSVMAARTVKKQTPKVVVVKPAQAPAPVPQSTTPPPPSPKISEPITVAPAPTQAPVVSVAPTPLPVVVPKTTAVVKIAGVGTYTVEIKEGDTALDVLKNAASENGFSVATTTYSFGIMVDGIAGQMAAGTNFWSFYYNGAQSMVGAADQTINNGDNTEWRFESWQ